MTRARNLSKLSNPATFTVDTDNNVGVNSTIPKEKLNIVGVVSATSFFGDGSSLSGITGGATLGAASGSQRVVVTSLTSGTMTDAATDADLAWNSTTNTLSATNINVSGTLTYEDVTNVDSLGIVTARTGIKVTAGGIDVVGGGLTVTGVSTFSDGINVVGGGLTVTGISTFPDDVTFIGAAANITFDKSANALIFADDAEAKFGDSHDLRIYHDGAHSIIRDVGTGDLRIAGNIVKINNNDNTATMLKATEGSSVELNHNNSKKLETTTTGITITGGVQVGSGQSFGANGPTAVYYGDGSNLTGIAAGISTAAKVISGIVTTLDLSSAQDHKQTVSGIVTFTCSGGTEGDSHTIRIINSGITTVGFSTYFLFPSGATPSLPTADGAISLISFTVNRVGAGAGVASTELLAGASVNFS